MTEIVCPKCHTPFKIDEVGYADILKQVRDADFEKQLHERIELVEKDKQNAIKLAEKDKESEIQDLKAKLEKEYNNLKNQLTQAQKDLQNHITAAAQSEEKAVELAKTQVTASLEKSVASKDAEIQDLKAKLDAAKQIQKNAVNEAVNPLEKERDDLKNQLIQAQKDLQNHITAATQSEAKAVELVKTQVTASLEKTVAGKDAEIQDLKAKLEKECDRLTNELNQAKKDKESAVELAKAQAASTLEKATAAKDTEIQDLKNKISNAATAQQLSENAIKEKYEAQLKERDDAIERLRDLKDKLSTKMLGETLELHCENSFNQIRAMAFPNAYFEKDNDARDGSKGDYIFRDKDEEGTEIISVMFEMKNESETTATKKKNNDFLDKLDKDRTAKGCEYAVLVSRLEADNELYNSGIVDVSHRYPKMYVIRPQFFIPLISLLRNSAINALKYKTELALVKAQNIDITNFENKLLDFKSGFERNYTLASKHFQTVIKEIDESIKHLEKVKKALTSSENNLRLAHNKLEDVTIRKLTWNNPTMKAKFEELKNDETSDSK